MKCALELASIAQRARNAEYNPKRFAACIVRIKDPKTTALMFNSGKMVIAGAKSEDQSRLAARKVTNHASPNKTKARRYTVSMFDHA